MAGYIHRYCDCEDYPCCGHTDDDGSDSRTDEEIKQSIYEMGSDELEDYWRLSDLDR